jgi:protein-disulfide isomerase
VPREPLSLAGAPAKGSQTAKVAIVQYSEFECPYCGRFAADTLPLIEREYVRAGRVLLAFRHFPMEKIHGSAVIAAAGAECTSRQGRFWELHDRLFTVSPPFTIAAVSGAAEAVALDAARFSTCMAGEGLAKVREDMAGAQELGVTGTPTFLIGRIEPDGRVRVRYWLSGARPFTQFSTILDGLLRGVESSAPPQPQRP